jgi:hypothetical protein
MLSSTRPSCVYLGEGLGTLFGHLGKTLGTLRCKVPVCALESLSGRRHKPTDTGSKNVPQVPLLLAQQCIEHQGPTHYEVY